MDNKEFARVLLSEATDILSEAARYKELNAYGSNSVEEGKKAATRIAMNRKNLNNPNVTSDEIQKNNILSNMDKNVGKSISKRVKEDLDAEARKRTTSAKINLNNKINERTKAQNEDASYLLDVAMEILTEAGARQKYLKILANKQDNVRDAKETVKKRITSEPDKVEYYGKSPLKSKIDTLQLKRAARLLEAEDKKLAKEGKKYSNRVSKDLSDSLNDDHRMHTNTFEYKKDRKAKEQFMKDFGGKKPKNASLHERINKRTSQNESIAIILTEAALLLNEED